MNADPCIYCGRSTAPGSGLFVNRIPADVEDDNGHRSGWGCVECTEPIAYTWRADGKQDGRTVTTCEDCTTDDERNYWASWDTWSDLVESGIASLRCDRCGETIYARTGDA